MTAAVKTKELKLFFGIMFESDGRGQGQHCQEEISAAKKKDELKPTVAA